MGKYIIDISHYNTVKNWEQVKKTCSFLITKAYQSSVDPYLCEFIAGCEKHKIPYMLYCYITKCKGESITKKMVETCKDKVGPYFRGYIVDAEYNNSLGTRPTDSETLKSLKYLKTLGIKFGLYTTHADVAKYKESIQFVKNEEKGFWWEARYGANDGTDTSDKYPCHVGADLHQYTARFFDDIGINVAKKTKDNEGLDVNRLTGTKSLEWFTEKDVKAIKKVTSDAKVSEKKTTETITDKDVLIIGHGSGNPRITNLNTYSSERYAKKAANGKRKGVVAVMRLKALTDADRKKVLKKIAETIKRNIYSQNYRNYVYRMRGGKYYSDCSSIGCATLKEVGYKLELLNTAGIYNSNLFEKVPCEIKNGHITNPGVLKAFDAVLYVGNDSSRPLQIGHVEWVWSILPHTRKSATDIAKDIVNGKGMWGNGEARKQTLKAAGYDYKKIQTEVNELLKQ